MEALDFPLHYASADEPALKDRAWVEAQWDLLRLRARGRSRRRRGALLVLDEVQKIPGWSEVVKER